MNNISQIKDTVELIIALANLLLMSVDTTMLLWVIFGSVGIMNYLRLRMRKTNLELRKR